MTRRLRAGFWPIGFFLLLCGCASKSIGLVPIAPKHDAKIKADSLTLAWEPSSESAEEVRYQLVVLDEKNTSIYEADDLDAPRHAVRADLEPGEYQWTVRPLHLRNGEWIPGVWSQREYFHFAVIFFGWGEERYRFTLTQPVHGKPAPIAAVAGPHVYAYRTIGGTPLKAYVFSPSLPTTDHLANAVLLFHGGGWAAGAPDWVFTSAERFASYGLVAIAIEYRLSNGSITPIDAFDDACHALEWARAHASELGIGSKIAGYGVSAGGQLVAAAATVGCGSSDPKLDALLLWSPAVDVVNDGYFARLLQGRGRAIDYSPADHVGAKTPPTCIVQGARDTLTPLSGAQKFHDGVVKAGGVCELNVYPDVGHLLTRKLDNQESDFDPDPEKRADGIEKFRRFLIRMGFIQDV